MASKFLSIPESSSESTFFVVLSSPFGRTPISFDTTSVPAMDLAMDSARAFSSSVATLPERVTTLPILTHAYVIQAGLVQRVPNVSSDIGSLRPVGASQR